MFAPLGAVQAGFLASLSDIFANSIAETASAAISPHNSQTLALLEAARNLDPNPAKGGGDITIVSSALLPDAGPSGTIADIESRPPQGSISVYTVRAGDTVSEIADMFGVSVNTIFWANDIPRASALKAGQTLVILPVSGTTHKVAKGDTLASIAKKYKADLEEIADFNNLDASSALAVGTELIIPDGEVAAPVVPKTTAPARNTSGPSYAGYYIRPIVNAVRSQGLHGYNGVDLAGPYGEPILAAAAGTVIIARDYGYNGGYGFYVVITHSNGTQTLYAHLSQVFVSPGQYVAQGQVIGREGSTGKATGPHLHFEIRGAKNPF